VLLTGATGGIGQAIARALDSQGARVLLTARRADELERVAAELGGRPETLPADLTYDASSLADRAGAVDVLVANAALPASGQIDDFTPEQIDRALDVNLRAPIQLTRELLPGMVERGQGHIVFVSSLSGKVASVGSALYSATKFGLRGFALGLREDLRDSGVGVSTVFPGFIKDAGMFHEAKVDLPPGVSMRSPEQVAAAVIQGIKKNRSEIDVAPITLRSGAWLAGISQSTVQRIQKIAGGDKVSAALGEGQRDKRT